MAIVHAGMYDYNGHVYAFGVVSGLSGVKSVRMYLSNGKGTTYQYLSSEIYDEGTANINTGLYGEEGGESFVFNVRTDRDAINGSPTQLSYDNEVTVEEVLLKGVYKVSFHFYGSSNGGGDPINSNVLIPYIEANGSVFDTVWYKMHNSLKTPKMIWDEDNKKIKLSNVGNYRYMIELRRTNRWSVDEFVAKTGWDAARCVNFTPEVRDYAYTVNMKSLEGTMGGKYTEYVPHGSSVFQSEDGNPSLICTHFNPDYYHSLTWKAKAIVVFDSGANFTSNEKEEYLNIAENALSKIAEYTGMTISVTSDTSSSYTKDTYATAVEYANEIYYQYDLIVRIGKSGTIGFNSGQSGTWSALIGFLDDVDYGDPSAGVISSVSTICIDNAETYESIAHVIHEEIYQSLGIGVDCFEHPLSVHWDPGYTNPESYGTLDAEVLKFFYSRGKKTNSLCGYTPIKFINELDTICGLVKDVKSSSGYYEFDLSELADDEYEVYGWVADEGSYTGGTASTSEGNGVWDGSWDDAPYSIKSYMVINTSGGPTTELWDWEIGQGTDRDKAYQAITNKGSITDFKYTVWNDIVKKTKEVIDNNNDVWHTTSSSGATYKDYNSTLMTSSDRGLTAARFNALRFNIGARSSTEITDRARGDVVKGHYFIALTNCLNAWASGYSNYVVYPHGKNVGTPYIETNAGGYYYKYSNGHGIKSVSTEIDFSDVVMKFNEDKPNFGYVFLTCNGSFNTSGPEFGICTTYKSNGSYGTTDGDWVLYKRDAGSTDVVRYDNVVIIPKTGVSGDGYTYMGTGKITLRITLKGTDIVGEVFKDGTYIDSVLVSGSAVNIGESAEVNMFTLGVSYVPNPQSENYTRDRDAYLKHVKLLNGQIYEEVDYVASHDWIPENGNLVTYYGLVVKPGHTTYTNHGNLTEEISISYE